MQLHSCNWMQGVTNSRRCLRDSSVVQCLPSFQIYVSSNCFDFINNKVIEIAESWSIRHILLEADAFSYPNNLLHTADNLFFEAAEIISAN